MLWREITKWATAHGYKVSKKNDAFVWHKLDDPDKCGNETNQQDLVQRIFNEITGYKWLRYQQDLKSK
jgi:hypothetical protein